MAKKLTWKKDFTYTFFAIWEYMIVFSNIAYHYHSGNVFGSSILMISNESQLQGSKFFKYFKEVGQGTFFFKKLLILHTLI